MPPLPLPVAEEDDAIIDVALFKPRAASAPNAAIACSVAAEALALEMILDEVTLVV